MNEPIDVHAEIARLVDRWCERRDLKPLRIVLGAWPLCSGLTDEIEALARSLKHLKAMCRESLPPDELETVRILWSQVQQSLDRRE